MQANTLTLSTTDGMNSEPILPRRFDTEARRIRQGIRAARLRTDYWIEQLSGTNSTQAEVVAAGRTNGNSAIWTGL